MTNLRFGINNLVEIATLSSTPDPVTDLEDLKNEWRARVVKFTDFSAATLVIEGVLAASAVADFFAIPGSNLTGDSTVKLELFETDVSTTDLLAMTPIGVVQPIPLGIWRSGTDPYGERLRVSMGNIVSFWFAATISWRRFKLTITHGYSTSTPVANTTPRQDAGTGIVALEAESGIVANVSGNTWTSTSDGTASGSFKMVKAGAAFYHSATPGPSMTYVFTAALNGAHTLYARVKSTSGANSFYSTFDGVSSMHILSLNADWHWVALRTVTLISDTDHTLVVSARDYAFHIDKLVIQSPGTAAPTGTGPAVSGFGTTTSQENVSLRMLMIGEKLQLDANFSHGNTIQFMTEPDLLKTASGYVVPGQLQTEARSMSLPLDMMSAVDRLLMADMEIRLAGKPFLVSAYPDTDEWTESAHTMLGMFDSALTQTHRDPGFFRSSLRIHEA